MSHIWPSAGGAPPEGQNELKIDPLLMSSCFKSILCMVQRHGDVAHGRVEVVKWLPWSLCPLRKTRDIPVGSPTLLPSMATLHLPDKYFSKWTLCLLTFCILYWGSVYIPSDKEALGLSSGTIAYTQSHTAYVFCMCKYQTCYPKFPPH